MARTVMPGQAMAVEETQCLTRGDPACQFLLTLAPAD
jgi:predicted hydrocarbon binding protein